MFTLFFFFTEKIKLLEEKGMYKSISTLYGRRLNSAVLFLMTTDGVQNIVKSKDDNIYEADVSAEIFDRKLGIVLYEGESIEYINKRIKILSKNYDYLCLMFFDSAQRAELAKKIPVKCGMLCNGNLFGNGMVSILYWKWS